MPDLQVALTELTNGLEMSVRGRQFSLVLSVLTGR
jgi:hypothetical protein